MNRQVDEGSRGDGEGGGADRRMGIGDADDLEKQRYRQDRAAAADEPEREPDQGAREDCKGVVHRRAGARTDRPAIAGRDGTD